MKNVAVIGFGTVGSGVCELLEKNSGIISKKAGEDIRLKYICDLIDFNDSVFSDRMIKDANIIINDPQTDIVVETIGGRGAAYALTKAALCAGKSVVTSNKEVVAYHGAELMRLACENNVKYLFEASVGGAIPVLRPMAQCLGANEIRSAAGVVNGTTNYILTQMFKHGKSYDGALREAKEMGYAEKDPTADVDGFDTCRKICILAAIMTGSLVSPDEVSVCGISKITRKDVEAAEAFEGGTIKLLGVARRTPGGLYIEVAPHFIPSCVPLSGIEGVFNGVLVDTDAAGEVMFYGRGAGKMPTASAVVADIIDIVMHEGCVNAFQPWRVGLCVKDDGCAHRYLMRVGGNNIQGFIEKYKPGEYIYEQSVISFVTPHMTCGEYGAFRAEYEAAGYSTVSSYRAFE